ncbi:hypothetical protein EN816_00655 [Mesorhizobium sp. M8A.F.Ca.ET.173.01.1.1]|nr:hypothetical protein EN816_00655 [Mesorhizobium sp. M8A.F.Ca.ET.173.01.1.1]
MNLADLIASYGDDVQFQNLDDCTDSLSLNKKGITKVTFGTQQPFNLDGIEKLGLVVWMDRDRVKQIMADAKATA